MTNKRLPKSKVVFVDDDQSFVRRLVRDLEANGVTFETLVAADEISALKLIEQEAPDAAVVDLTLDMSKGPDSGLSLISKIHKADPTLRIIVLTGQDGEDFGVQALQRGASSFLHKPGDAKHLSVLLQDGVVCTALKRRFLNVIKTPLSLVERIGLSTKSPDMLKVLESVAYASATNQPVLLLGETGTGKSILAQAIHRASSRSRKSFIRVQPNFTGYDLISSELFGHSRGAFTGALTERRGLIEESNGGTLFVDEVDLIPQETQAMLLSVFQDRVFRRLGSNAEIKSDFRLIAASNKPKRELISPSALREDFFHRISHCTIEIPPLRDRKEDIADLAQEVVTTLADRESLPIQGLTPESIEKLRNYTWPGNIRELQAVVESAVFRAGFEQRSFVDVQDIRLDSSEIPSEQSALSFRERIQRFECEIVQEALKLNGNNQSKAADSLQLDRSSFRRILQRIRK